VLKNEREYTNLIPFQNTLITPVDFSPFPEMIQGFEVHRLKGPYIELRFQPVRDNYTYNLYRSSQRVTEITEADPVDTVSGSAGAFTVQVAENTPYYFIIIPVNRLWVENPTILIGKNENELPFLIKKAATIKS